MGLSDFFKPKSQPEQQADASSRMLRQLRARRGEETGKWLALMRDEVGVPVLGPPPKLEDVDKRDTINETPYSPSLESQYAELNPKTIRPGSVVAAPPKAPASTPAEKNETVDWVKKLFQEFSLQATEFNATASGTELVMTVRPPEFTFETPHFGDYDPAKKIKVFKGHIATTHWAMLVQGYNDKIDVYVIPSESILNFTLNDIRKSELSPFMTIDSTLVDGHQVWTTSGHAVTPETLPLLAKELLGDLVRIGSGTMNESELFAHHTTDLKLGETVAQGYAPPLEPMPTSSLIGESSAPTPIEALATWSACEALLQAIFKDLGSITSNEGALDSTKDEASIQRLHDLSGRLRNLSGELSGLIAEYQPTKGSKYNPS
jgi:hypothetical protein